MLRGGELEKTSTFLCRSIEIRIGWNATFYRRCDHRGRQGPLVWNVGDAQGPATAMQAATSALVILCLLEKRQYGVPVSALQTALTPAVIVSRRAAHINGAVDGAAATQDLAARLIQDPVIQ